jgi:Ca2+-binding EF-hand superfamily protein
VIKLFNKYDKDQSGFIEQNELTAMTNDLLKELGQKKQYNQN